ncbi:MAG: UDP-3-O-(3-hydroxymyristoyl)glucosamine N-acyltransferase [Pirellula sp.]
MAGIAIDELALQVDGELMGIAPTDEALVLTGAVPLSQACPGCITLVDDVKHAEKLARTQASAVVTPKLLPGITIPQIVVANPHEAFAAICSRFKPAVVFDRPHGAHPTSIVHSSAKIDRETFIDAGVSIDADCSVGAGCHLHRGVTLMPGCKLGRDCQLFPGVVLYPGTILGDRVILHANTVIGAHGFGYKFVDGKHQPSPQLGWVEIEDDVEVGANTTIDRGTYGVTRIGTGTKIDNLVQIAHNCIIGKHNLICSQVGIAGSSSTGDYVVLAGQVGLKDHIHIGDRAQIAAQSGVAADVEPDRVLLGSPAAPIYEQAQVYAAMSKLPEMRKTVRRLEHLLAKPDKSRE